MGPEGRESQELLALLGLLERLDRREQAERAATLALRVVPVRMGRQEELVPPVGLATLEQLGRRGLQERAVQPGAQEFQE